MDELKLISGFSIFSGPLQDLLPEISKYVEMLDFSSGEVIFGEGEEASKVYGLIEGEVELVLVAKDDIIKTDVRYEEYTRSKTETVERDIVVDSIGAGDIFGWSALTAGGHYTSKAICVEPTRVFALPADSLRAFFAKHPQAGYPFMERLVEVISQRLANRTKSLIEVWSEAFNVNRI
jgi:CRP-like cAMP-binding protein